MKRFFAPIIIRVTQAYTKLFPNILKKRTWWPIFLVTIVLIAVVSVLPVHAQFPLEDLLNGLVELVGRILIELSKLCIFLAIFFLRLFITLASYNNYIDVSVVKLGWVMVRDVANMFFIVGLLVIAFATILGLESYEWKKGVVKIVLMAILINFSNLIAQLIIDVAHIFTITFLNAVSATAGGNLITLFQLDNILKLTAGAPNEFGDTRQVASLTLFAGSALAFVFALLAALSIGAYLIVMIARIVVLWALIILSPLAFMLYALPQGEDYAKQWWSEFSKHVIVAPIMVFFLWLAFATFGTGQVINEIQSGENVIQINATGEAETVGKQSVSILEISTWENLASFLLGIAFLWVGIKKTEETGAMGSGLVGNAIDFTKNVATIATGYAAGRWIVGKGVEGGKALAVGGANRIPIIGGAALKEYGHAIKATYQKKGLIGVLSRGKSSGLGGYKSMVERSDRAKKLEEKGGAWNWMKARWIEPTGRALKRAKDWEEGAERVHEAMEHSYSTSGSKAGQAKIEATLDLQDIEHRAEAKKEAKLAERNKENKIAADEIHRLAEELMPEEMKDEEHHLEEEEKKLKNRERELQQESENEWREKYGKKGVLSEEDLKNRDKYYSDTFKKKEEKKKEFEKLEEDRTSFTEKKAHFEHEKHEFAEGQIPDLMRSDEVLGRVKQKVIDEMTKGMTGEAKEKEAKKLNRFMERDGGVKKRIFDGLESHKIHKQTHEEKASTEEANKFLRRASEKAEAEARDEILIAQNLTPRYVANVKTKHQKEDEEERAGLNYKELTAQAGAAARALKKVRDAAKVEKVTPVVDPALLKSLGTTLVASMKRGYEYETAAMSEALEAIGFKEKINADDMLGQQRRLLSAVLGRKIEKSEEGDLNGILKREFVDVVGEDEAQAFLKELDTGIKAAVKEGGVNLTGLLDDSNLVNGRINYRLRDESQLANFHAGRDYWAQEVSLPHMLGLGDIVNRGKDGITLRVVKEDGTTGDIDKRALRQLATAFASFKKNTRLHNRTVADIQALFKDDVKAFDLLIEELGGVKSEAGQALKAQAEGKKEDREGGEAHGPEDAVPI